MISIEDFKKVEMTIGEILSVERVPDTDKLLKLKVDFGVKPSLKTEEPVVPEGEEKEERAVERDIRQVISGIAEFFEDPQVLVHVKCPFVTNLEPRTIRGLESQAMIVAAHSKDGVFSVLEPTGGDISVGTKLN